MKYTRARKTNPPSPRAITFQFTIPHPLGYTIDYAPEKKKKTRPRTQSTIQEQNHPASALHTACMHNVSIIPGGARADALFILPLDAH